MSYDTQNIFAKILRDEMPCHKVYEDEKTFAFMDIMPRTVGHALVIPKNGSRNILDVEPEDLQAVIITSQKIGKAAMKAFGAPGLNIMQFNEPAGGQEVYHLHFHVLPRYEDVALLPPGKMGDQKLLAEHAEKLKSVLADM
ncbi:MAG: HIT family protein [Methyloligellaceae bacterium]